MQASLATSAMNERVETDAMRLFLSQWRGTMLSLLVITCVVMMAWRHLVGWQASLPWAASLLLAYAVQAWVASQLERAPDLASAIQRTTPWLLGAIMLSGCTWGMVPWLLIHSTSDALILSGLFNLLLAFCVANAPGTRAMHYSGLLPLGSLTTLALLWHGDLRYVGLLCLMLLGLIFLYGLRLQDTLRDAMIQRHVANDLLADLRAHQHRLLTMERERVTLQEREQLMRAMHDGLGSTLISSLALAERGDLDAPGVALLLRECVDEARLVVDSLDQIEHDLATLLGSLRQRWASRLEAAGLHLRWHVEDLPPLPWLNPPAALQVLRIVQEALANVIKHAHARHLNITLKPLDGRQVSVSIQDDGLGFDAITTAPHGRGLRHLSQRAAQLGGHLHVRSQTGQGTEVTLILPVVNDHVPH